MRVIARRTLIEYAESCRGHRDYPALKAALETWFAGVSRARWQTSADVKQRYSANDAILYALGIGLGRDPLNADELRFLYEDGLAVLPTFAVVLGYPGHLWSQGFADYTKPYNLLNRLMQGAANWRELARTLHVRYIFWGGEERSHYAASKRPWETTTPVVASGPWGAIYDLEPTGD